MATAFGRIVFNIGDAFPPTDPVAVFLVALSTALNDLLLTNRRLVSDGDDGGDDDELNLRDVTAAERQFLLRLSVSHVWELRESIRHARQQSEVEAFITALPDTARSDLARIQDLNTTSAHWIRAAMEHTRNQANHYGGKWNWDDVQWAMTKVGDRDGAIEFTTPNLAGMRLTFADQVAVQPLTRKFPEFAQDPAAEVSDEQLNARIRTLFTAVQQATSAAIGFTNAAVKAYLDGLPGGVVRVET